MIFPILSGRVDVCRQVTQKTFIDDPAAKAFVHPSGIHADDDGFETQLQELLHQPGRRGLPERKDTGDTHAL